MASIRIKRIVDGKPRDWTIADPAAKLKWRGSLPGAFGFDQAVQSLRVLQARGTDVTDLLPSAFPTSWMVNSRATSRAFQRWLLPPMRDAWITLFAHLRFDSPPEHWLTADPVARAGAETAVRALMEVPESGGLAAVSKVLALLRPQLVPLMDDALVWFALESVPRPESAEASIAPPTMFAPMMSWFCEAVRANETALVQLAAGHDSAVLDGSQVLDRLLWFESWGYRLGHPAKKPPTSVDAVARFWSVRDGEREAIVRIMGPHPEVGPATVIDLADKSHGEAWIVRARDELSRAFRPA